MSDDQITVVDPRTGASSGEIPAGSRAAVDVAVEEADRAFATWSALPQRVRSQFLRDAAGALRGHREELAAIESRDAGKLIDDAQGEVDAAIDSFDHFAEAATDEYLEQPLPDGDLIRRRPFGVAALIVPWNFPLLIAFRFLPGMLSVGNTVVWKPSERTPWSAIRAHEILSTVLPAGVIELVLGDGRAGKPLAEDPRVKLISLTGSTGTGIQVGEASGRLLRPALLELGGKDAVIIDQGVDVEFAARLVAEGAFSNAGQICTSMERIFVHRAVADEFIERLTNEATGRWSLETQPGGHLGPMIDERQRSVVESHVADAVARGARVVTGGVRPDGPGSYFPATVLVDITDEMLVMTAETFGPIAPVAVVDNFEEGVRRAASEEYGLAATLVTTSEASIAAASVLDVGIVWINSWHGYAEGALHEAGGRSGLGAIGWKGKSFLDAVSAPQFVSRGGR
jgi:acyl-CoA reductase-like NAD-dependent aldehyde dehydrogenase